MENHSHLKSNWYAVYTYPNAERKVYNKAKEMGVETYLPVQTVVRQWSDRKKKLEVPLFPGYVFVRTSLMKRFGLLKIKELVRFVSFGGQPVAIPEKEIESVQKISEKKLPLESEPFQAGTGRKVLITDGQFAGTEGVFIKRKGKERLLIQLEVLKQSISVEIPRENVLAQ